MSDPLEKPRFVRKLEFGLNSSDTGQNKLKSCKQLKHGRNNQTLFFASLKNDYSCDENPFLSSKKINNQPSLPSRNSIDTIPGSSNNEPEINTNEKRGRRSPDISSSSKNRLKINHANRRVIVPNQMRTEVTKNLLNSPQIKRVVKAPRSSSKFDVSACLETNASSKHGFSPSYKLQGNISWNETSVNDSELITDNVNIPKSPCIKATTPIERRKNFFKRSKLKIIPEENQINIDCNYQSPKKVGINSEFLKKNTENIVNLSPVSKTGKSHSVTELEKSPCVLAKMTKKRFPRLSKTPEKTILPPSIENQSFQKGVQQFLQCSEFQQISLNIQNSPIVISRRNPCVLETEKSTPKKIKLHELKNSSPIIALKSSNNNIKTKKKVISFNENDKKSIRALIEDGSEDMIIDSQLVKPNLVKSKRKNKTSLLLKTSKLKKRATPKSPNFNGMINENVLSSPEMIKRSPVLSKNTKSLMKRLSTFPRSNKMTFSGNGSKNVETNLNEPDTALIMNDYEVALHDGLSFETSSGQKRRTKALETQNLLIPFSEHSPTVLNDSLKMSSRKRKCLDNNDLDISRRKLICKSPEISSVKRKRFDGKNKASDMSSFKNSPTQFHPESPEISCNKRKSTEHQNSTSVVPNSLKVSLSKSPKMSLIKHKGLDGISGTSFSKIPHDLSQINTREISLVMPTNSGNQIKDSAISFSKSSSNTSFCKSQEISILKRKSSVNHVENSYVSYARNFPKSTIFTDISKNNHSLLVPKSSSLIIGTPPKCNNVQNSMSCKIINDANKSPEVVPQKKEILECLSAGKVKKIIFQNKKFNSSISFSEHSLCKSSEVVSLKKKSCNVLNKNLNTSPKSPQVKSLKKKCVDFYNNRNLNVSSPKNYFSILINDTILKSKNEPNPFQIIDSSPDRLKSSLRIIEEKHKNSPKSTICVSPEISSVKRSSFNIHDQISNASFVANSPRLSSNKSPELIPIKRKNLQLQVPSRKNRNILGDTKDVSFSKNSCDSPLRLSNEKLAIQQKRLEGDRKDKLEAKANNVQVAENSQKTVLSESLQISSPLNSKSRSPITNKAKKRITRVLCSSNESYDNVEDLKIECSSETATVSDQLFLKKDVAKITKIGLETQCIDEFYTETLQLAAATTKNEGWSSEAAISEILSEEKSRQSKSESSCHQAPAVKPQKRRKLKSKDSLSAQLDAARKSLLSERRIREYERNKTGESLAGSKEFHVTEVWGIYPQKIQAITDEGEAMLILGEGLVYSQSDVKPGCIIRIYPPWQTITTQQGLTIYLSIRICDILPGSLPLDTKCFANVEEEISIEPYIEDPNLIMKVLLNEPNLDS